VGGCYEDVSTVQVDCTMRGVEERGNQVIFIVVLSCIQLPVLYNVIN